MHMPLTFILLKDAFQGPVHSGDSMKLSTFDFVADLSPSTLSVIYSDTARVISLRIINTCGMTS